MNKTFKVVFNRARGALMVANEVTSSVQKKGTKTVLATAAILATAFAAQAATSPAQVDWVDTTAPSATTYNYTFKNTDRVSEKNYLSIIEGKTAASGTLTNLNIKASATITEGSFPTSEQGPQIIAVFLRDNSNVTLAGDTLDIGVTTDIIGGGDNQITALYTQVNDGNNDKNTTLTVSAREVNLSSTSTGTNGKSAYAFAAYGGVVNFTGDTVTLKTDTKTERTTDTEYSETAGFLVGTYGSTYGTSTVTLSEKTNLVVEAKSQSEKATKTTKGNKSDRGGGSPAFGVKVDGGTLDAKGSANLTVTSNGANATGLQLTDTHYSTSTDTHYFSSTATVNNLTATVSSKTGTAYGVHLSSSTVGESEGNSISLTLTGDTKVKAESESSYAYGIALQGGNVTAEDNTDITLTSTSKGSYASYGVYLDGKSASKVELKGNVNINTNANGGLTSGVHVINGGEATINNLTTTVTSGSKAAYGVNLNNNGKAEITSLNATITSEGNDARGLYLIKASTAEIGTFTANVTSKNGSAYGAHVVYSKNNPSSLTLTGDVSITAETASAKAGKFAYGIYAKDGSVNSTGNVTITAKSTNSEATEKTLVRGVFAEGGATVNLGATGKTVSITATGLGESAVSAVLANSSTVTIKGKETTVTGSKVGLSALSTGRLTIDSNLTVEAPNVIDVRGNSVVDINTDGTHTTKLIGDVVFETDWVEGGNKSSDKLIDANVNLVLSGSDSSWGGRSYKEYAGSTYVDLSSAENYGAVTGFNLTLANGAKWTLSGDSFANMLALKDGGKIDASKATTLNVGKWDGEKTVAGFTVEGTGNELTLGSETTLNGAITMAEDSELITSLATAYKGVTLSDDEEKLATIGSDFGTRLTFSTDSDDSAILTINDVFTYTTDVLSKLTEAYEAVTVELANASLKLSPEEEAEVTKILVDLTTKSITGGTDLQLSDGKTLTVSGGTDAGESSVGDVSLGSADSSSTATGATLKTTAESTVTAKTISGNGLGTVAVAEKSTLNVETVKDVAMVDVASGSTIDAQKISGAVKILLSDESSLKATEIESNGAIELNKGSTIDVGTLSKGTETSGDVAVALAEGSKLLADVITDVDEVSLGEAAILTLGAEGVTAESSIEKISFAATDGEAATVNVTKAAKALVKTIEGDGNGRLQVGEKSTLEVETLTEVAELLVSDATLKATTIEGSGEITLSKDSTLDVETLKGASKILVGEVGGEGAKLSVKNLAMTGGSIFIDPAYGHSTFHVESLASGTLDTNITTGSGASVIFGSATEEEVSSAVSGVKGLSNVSALVFMKKGIKVGSAGSLIIDPTATAEVTGFEKKVLIRNGGTLVIDQTAVGNSAVFDEATALVIQNEANIGIVNAALGTINLGTTVTEEAGSTLTLYTDSPFLTASLASNGLITIAETADTDCISAVATMGIQSMIRHADAVLAETIADRIAEDKAGTGLWVAVRGERYEQDDVGSGFKADVGYGAFGADFAPTEGTRLGVAVQYGHGKVKGNAYSVKNKFKDYSATLYGSAILGDTGIKLLGEVAYTQSKNDVSTTYNAALNQDLDAKMYSAGITAQKSFAVGNVNITPSVGVRVSRIETDAMNAGPARIAKQKQTVVQVPVAVRLSTKALETASGWTVAPRFKVAYIPTFGDKKIDVFGAKSTVLDTSPVQGAFGVSFKKGGFAADIAVQGGVGNRGTSSIGGKIGLSYAF